MIPINFILPKIKAHYKLWGIIKGSQNQNQHVKIKPEDNIRYQSESMDQLIHLNMNINI